MHHLRPRHSWPLFVLLILASCSAPEPPQNPQETTTLQRDVVYGEDDRSEFHESEDPRWRGLVERSVVALIRSERINEEDPNNIQVTGAVLGESLGLCEGTRFWEQQRVASCSGTLIAEDLVLTAGHCVESNSVCADRRFVFGYYETAPGELGNITADDVYRCSELITSVNRNSLDYAVLRLDRPVTEDKVPVHVKRRDEAMELGTEVAVLGFPNGLPAKITPGGAVIVTREESLDFFEATADTFGGNSGSGVFDENGVQVGILVRGEQDYAETSQGCSIPNVLSSNPGAEEGAEDITYVARALEDLCARGWDNETLCGGDERELCFPCDADSQCRDDWTCNASEESDEVRICAPSCETDDDCRSDHVCQEGTCQPRLEQRCHEGDAWSFNACNQRLALFEDCDNDVSICQGGACVDRAEGDLCDTALEIDPVDQTLTGNLAVAYGSDLAGTCAGNGPDVIYSFTVDEGTGFRATASGFDTVLHLRGADCEDGSEDNEIACNDDETPPGGRGSFLEVELAPGTYHLVLDSYRGGGLFELNLEFGPLCEIECEPGDTICDGDVVLACVLEGECPAWSTDQVCPLYQGCFDGVCADPMEGDSCETPRPLDTSSDIIRSSLIGQLRNTSRGSCGGDGPEVVYSFDLEKQTHFAASAHDLDSVLYLRQSVCENPAESFEIECNDDIDNANLGSRIESTLEPGSYFLFMDSFNQARAGSYSLNLDFVEACEDLCALDGVSCGDEGPRTCALSANGCLEWGEETPCEPGTACQNGTCEQLCEDLCESGEVRCEEGAVSECGDHNQDGCTEWSTPEACEDGHECSDGVCVEVPEEPDMTDMPDLSGDTDEEPESDTQEDEEDEENAKNVVARRSSDGCSTSTGGQSPTSGILLLLGAMFWIRRRERA